MSVSLREILHAARMTALALLVMWVTLMIAGLVVGFFGLPQIFAVVLWGLALLEIGKRYERRRHSRE